MDFEKFLGCYGESIDEIIDLESLIVDCDGINGPPSSISEIPSKFLESKSALSQLISLIMIGMFSRNKFSQMYYNLLEELIPYIKMFFNEFSIYYFCLLPYSRLWFYRRQLISAKTIVFKATLNKEAAIYFSPEIYENDPKEFKRQFPTGKISQDFGVENLEEFKKLREKGVNHHEIAQAIRADDVCLLQKIISQTNLSVNSLVPYSIFENCILVNNQSVRPSLIEFAAYFSSINTFKFLLMNGAELTHFTFEYAVYGGSYEIIHMLEYHHCSCSTALEAAVRVHRNEIAYYLIETNGCKHNGDSILRSVTNYNLRIFRDVLPIIYENNGFIVNSKGENALTIAISQDFPDLVQLILKMKGADPNMPDSTSRTPLIAACQCGNYDIVKLLVEEYKVDVNARGFDGVFIFYFVFFLYGFMCCCSS